MKGPTSVLAKEIEIDLAISKPVEFTGNSLNEESGRVILIRFCIVFKIVFAEENF